MPMSYLLTVMNNLSEVYRVMDITFIVHIKAKTFFFTNKSHSSANKIKW